MTRAVVHYDPYDVAIDRDPYLTYCRLCHEAPLYSNERYDFWALSRFADVSGAARAPTTAARGWATMPAAIT